MSDLWSVFSHGDWPFGNTIKPKRNASVRESRSGEVVLFAPTSTSTITLDLANQVIWKSCD